MGQVFQKTGATTSWLVARCLTQRLLAPASILHCLPLAVIAEQRMVFVPKRGWEREFKFIGRGIKETPDNFHKEANYRRTGDN